MEDKGKRSLEDKQKKNPPKKETDVYVPLFHRKNFHGHDAGQAICCLGCCCILLSSRCLYVQDTPEG